MSSRNGDLGPQDTSASGATSPPPWVLGRYVPCDAEHLDLESRGHLAGLTPTVTPSLRPGSEGAPALSSPGLRPRALLTTGPMSPPRG